MHLHRSINHVNGCVRLPRGFEYFSGGYPIHLHYEVISHSSLMVFVTLLRYDWLYHWAPSINKDLDRGIVVVLGK